MSAMMSASASRIEPPHLLCGEGCTASPTAVQPIDTAGQVPPNDLLLEHDLIRPSFARRSGLREGGKPVPTFRDHAHPATLNSSRGVPVSTSQPFFVTAMPSPSTM